MRPTTPTVSPTPGPTPVCQYEQVGPSRSSKCNQTALLAPLNNPSLCDCQLYCLANGGGPAPIFFNYYSSLNTTFCYCSGPTCTIVPGSNVTPYKVQNATPPPTAFPTPAPTNVPPYVPVPLPPGSTGERCAENGTMTPLVNPTVDECWQYCSLYVNAGLTPIFYFNFYQLGSTSACNCVGKNCTLTPVPNWAPYQVNNKTIPTFGPSISPSAM